MEYAMPKQTKTIVETCSKCDGRGYKYDSSAEYSLINFHVGCERCGGSGRKGVDGHGTSKEWKENTLKKGSGKVNVTYEWDGIAKNGKGEPYWSYLDSTPKTGWF